MSSRDLRIYRVQARDNGPRPMRKITVKPLTVHLLQGQFLGLYQ